MPELPEVEVVSRDLSEALRGSPQLDSISFFRENLRGPLPLAAAKSWEKRRVQSIWRRAKYLVFDFSDMHLVSHLGMSGRWRVSDGTRKKHDHIHLDFEQGRRLIYNDPRRFGFFHILNSKDLAEYFNKKDLGPEPLNFEEFNSQFVFSFSKSKDKPIKTLLMDQSFVVGVGNIYASEALFWAGIHPLKKTRELTKFQWEKLIYWVREVLQDAIALGGSSIRDYSHVNGGGGSFQWSHMVYGRAEEPCVTCNKPISCTVLGGRSTFWCPRCQTL